MNNRAKRKEHKVPLELSTQEAKNLSDVAGIPRSKRRTFEEELNAALTRYISRIKTQQNQPTNKEIARAVSEKTAVADKALSDLSTAHALSGSNLGRANEVASVMMSPEIDDAIRSLQRLRSFAENLAAGLQKEVKGPGRGRNEDKRFAEYRLLTALAMSMTVSGVGVAAGTEGKELTTFAKASREFLKIAFQRSKLVDGATELGIEAHAMIGLSENNFVRELREPIKMLHDLLDDLTAEI